MIRFTEGKEQATLGGDNLFWKSATSDSPFVAICSYVRFSRLNSFQCILKYRFSNAKVKKIKEKEKNVNP